MRKDLLALAPALLMLAACESIDSANVRTDGIYASLTARSDGSGSTTVEARLKTGGSSSNTFLDLSDGDELVAYSGADKKEMDRESLLGVVWYEAEFDGDAENTPLRIEFSRSGHDEDETKCRGGGAPNSTVTMPSPFSINAPEEETRFSRKDAAVEITWSPTSSDPIRWELEGSCVGRLGDNLTGDSGKLVLEKGKIHAISEMRTGETCDVELRIFRARAGAVDPAYGEGGNFAAEQVRSVTIRSAP